MFRDCRIHAAVPLMAGLLWFAGMHPASAQERRPASRIDVQDYTIEADISPNTSSIAAKTTVRFVPMDDGLTSASFELNNALNVSRVVDDKGKQIQASRTQQDFSIRLTFDPPLAKGKPASVTFYYDGKLSGQEDSPGIWCEICRHPPGFRLPAVPGALVSGERLHDRSLRSRR
jgi:hypothetical protein